MVVKNPPANAGDIRDAHWIPMSERSPGLEKGNPLWSAWEIPWTEETGGLQSMGSQSQIQLSTVEWHSLPTETLKTVLLSSICMKWPHFSGYIPKQSIKKLFVQLFRQTLYQEFPPC